MSTINVYGLNGTLQQLAAIEPELRKQARARLRQAAEPVAATARSFIPVASPLSGWTRTKRYPWTGARNGIKVDNGKQSRQKDRIALIRIVQTNAAGAVYEVAGKATRGRTPAGRGFIANLPPTPRALWRAVDQSTSVLEAAVQQAVDDVEQMIGD